MARRVEVPAKLEMPAEPSEEPTSIMLKKLFLWLPTFSGADHSRRQDRLSDRVSGAVPAQRIEGQRSTSARQPRWSAEGYGHSGICRKLSGD